MTTTRYRRASGWTAAIALLGGQAAAAQAQEAVQVGALFTHGQPPAIYLSALGGVVSTALESFPNGPQLELRLGLGDGACRLWMMWAPDPKTAGQRPLSPTGPVETCLVRDDVNPAAFDDWLPWRHSARSNPETRKACSARAVFPEMTPAGRELRGPDAADEGPSSSVTAGVTGVSRR